MTAPCIVSVNTGKITCMADWRGRRVYSGIVKLPTDWSSLKLTDEGLEGDAQADNRIINGQPVHGGPLRAVYAYPWEHYEPWEATLRSGALPPGSFGENLTTWGIREQDVRIGDKWVWGEALLQVSGYRRPCAKLNLLRGHGVAEAMMQNGHCGWYLQVLRPGLVPTVGQLEIVERGEGLTILEAFQQKARTNPVVPGLPE